MANFNLAVEKTIKREGGSQYHCVNGDKGGATKYGISQRSYPLIDIENLSEFDAKRIYKKDYWNQIRGDDISSQKIAESLFDFAVNAGVKTSVRLAQIALDVDQADGIMGKMTIDIINNEKEDDFLRDFSLAKIARYAAICNKDKSQSKFLLGWINRTLEVML
jgi:lysozyme family protein